MANGLTISAMWRLLTTGCLGIAIGAVLVWVLFSSQDDRSDPPPTPLPKIEPSSDQSTPPQGRNRLSLADIAALADDFERNAALYGLLANASVGEIEGLLAEVESLNPAPHRPDVVRVLYIRFAALDPMVAADHVITGAYRSSWVRAVFRAWAHADLDAAVARAATLDGDAKVLATRTILELELQRREIRFSFLPERRHRFPIRRPALQLSYRRVLGLDHDLQVFPPGSGDEALRLGE